MTTYGATLAGPGRPAAFLHPALFYGDEDEDLDGVGAFIQDALDREHAVLVAVPGPRLPLLQNLVESRHRHARWVDMHQAGRNPGRILSMLQEFADRAGDDVHTGVSIVGEPIWVGRTPAEAWEATRHEALINLAFAGRPVSILCPYDTALPKDVLTQAYRIHPVIGVLGDTVPAPATATPMRSRATATSRCPSRRRMPSSSRSTSKVWPWPVTRLIAGPPLSACRRTAALIGSLPSARRRAIQCAMEVAAEHCVCGVPTESSSRRSATRDCWPIPSRAAAAPTPAWPPGAGACGSCISCATWSRSERRHQDLFYAST